MRRILLLTLAATASLPANSAAPIVVPPAPPILQLNHSRNAASDLEISGNLPGLPVGTTRYIPYDSLRRLPQVTFTASADDENFSTGFTQPVTVSGIPLDVLERDLGVDPSATLIIALCSDGYRTNYPSEYVAAHRPVLVLAVNGLPSEKWPHSHYGVVMAPYIISHEKYSPAFHILAHSDEQQIPYAVTRIEFTNQQTAFAAIAPPGHHAAGSPEILGYRIAQQNCYRCHNMGSFGGKMANHPWQVLAAWAAYQPDYFAAYVHDPTSLRKNARMPGNPEYDASTLDVLRRYFATFATPAKERSAR